MKPKGYYSSGEFARMANVSVRTIRFYDDKNILKPSYVAESGARYYTAEDFTRLQQILLLKYLGFTLKEISEMIVSETDYHFLLSSLKIQKKLVQDKIEQMQLVASAIDNTVSAISREHQVDWSRMLDLIHLTGIEQSLKSQYRNASNISARISLHENYSLNPQGWFPWVFEQCQIRSGMWVLELGCGSGALWTENLDKLTADVTVVLSDISDGMIRDVRRSIGNEERRFQFHTFDCQRIPYERETFDLVIANHLLFYCEDLQQVLRQVWRVLKPGGRFLCSTYSSRHMHEITDLVQQFDSRIRLSGDALYEQFGLENGGALLESVFPRHRLVRYEDGIALSQAGPLIEYILSCHGNQNQYLLERYSDFRAFVEEKVKPGFLITKDVGLFLCEK